jgi:hypothetical protein
LAGKHYCTEAAQKEGRMRIVGKYYHSNISGGKILAYLGHNRYLIQSFGSKEIVPVSFMDYWHIYDSLDDYRRRGGWEHGPFWRGHGDTSDGYTEPDAVLKGAA